MPGIETDQAAEIRSNGGTAGGVAEKPVDGFAHLQNLPERCVRRTQADSGEAPPPVEIGEAYQPVLAPLGASAVNNGIGEIERRQVIDEVMVLPDEGDGFAERFDRALFRFHANQQSDVWSLVCRI